MSSNKAQDNTPKWVQFVQSNVKYTASHFKYPAKMIGMCFMYVEHRESRKGYKSPMVGKFIYLSEFQLKIVLEILDSTSGLEKFLPKHDDEYDDADE